MGFLLDFLDSHTSIDWNGDGKNRLLGTMFWK